MNDLVAWLRAQLDEDERVARATGALHPWVATEEGEVFSVVGLRDPHRCTEHPAGVPNMCDDLLVATGEDISDQRNDERAAHIARHDPARVLREVAAKRAIVDAVERHLAGHPGPCVDDGGVVLESGLDFQLYGPCERHEEWNRTSLPMLAAQLLASAYSDRPGYREEWAP